MKLLVELCVEELPSRLIDGVCRQVRARFVAFAREKRLVYEDKSLRVEATPRRVALLCELLGQTRPVEEEERGPRTDTPTLARDKFAEKMGVSPEVLEKRQTDKGSYYYHVRREEAVPVRQVLPTFPRHLLDRWKVSMRWGSGTRSFIRPIEGIVVLLDADVLEGTLDLGGGNALPFGRETVGPRFRPESVSVPSADRYEETISRAGVILSGAERREIIRKEVGQCTGRVDEELVSENAGLVEYPAVARGDFPRKYLELPHELISLVLKKHQKCFVGGKEVGGRYVPDGGFYTVLNGNFPKDVRASVMQGHERVITARLEDAFFFFARDMHTTPRHYEEVLQKVVDRREWGSIWDKVIRMRALFRALWKEKEGEGEVEQMLAYAKYDLGTGTVREFPELQGVIGSYYAQGRGLKERMAEAIYHQYETVPTRAVARIREAFLLALVDRLDSVMGSYLLGTMPTGSGDPYAVRRKVLGMVHWILTRWRANPKSLELLMGNASVEDWLAIARDVYVHRYNLRTSPSVAPLARYMGERLGDVLGKVFPPYIVGSALRAKCIGFGTLEVILVLSEWAKNTPEKFEALLHFYRRLAGFRREAETVTPRPFPGTEDMVRAPKERLEKLLVVGKRWDSFADRHRILAEDKKERGQNLAYVAHLLSLFDALGDFDHYGGLEVEQILRA